jgi:uncharacterized protein (DUF305 family)
MKTILFKTFLIGCSIVIACADKNHDSAETSHDEKYSDTLMQPDSMAHSSAMPGSPMMMEDMSKAMMQQIGGKTGNDFDKVFLPLMAAHHQGAVAMAEDALKKSQRTEIKNIAQSIISSQKDEMTKMSQWFTNWFPGENFSANDGGMGAHMMQMLSAKNGTDFDMEFLRLMIAHHRDGVMMAKSAIMNAGHTEVKTLAQAIITAQEKEIAQMQKWQQDWFPAVQ